MHVDLAYILRITREHYLQQSECIRRVYDRHLPCVSLLFPQVYYGFGFLLGSAVFFLITALRLGYFTQRLPYYILSVQPIVEKISQDDLHDWGRFLEEKLEGGEYQVKRNRLISAVCVLSLALSLCAGGCSEKKEESKASGIKTETQTVKRRRKKILTVCI